MVVYTEKYSELHFGPLWSSIHTRYYTVKRHNPPTQFCCMCKAENVSNKVTDPNQIYTS